MLANRARQVRDRAVDSDIRVQIAEIELDASSVRMVLTDVLRGAAIIALDDLEARMDLAARRLDAIEDAVPPDPESLTKR